MVTAKQVINSTKPKRVRVPKGPTKLGSAGYDNIRDDIEKTKSLREGTMEKVPVNNNDIVNKLALDTAIAGVTGLWEVDGTETQLKTADEIDMQTKKIINLVDPTANQEAATKKYVDDEDAAADAHITAEGSSHSFINQNVTTTGTPTFGITTLADNSTLATSGAPVADAEIANKLYVDNTNLWNVVGAATQLKVGDEIDMQARKIITMDNPTNPQDATTKSYVDTRVWESMGYPETGNIVYNGNTQQGYGLFGGFFAWNNVGGRVIAAGNDVTFVTAGAGPGPFNFVGNESYDYTEDGQLPRLYAKFTMGPVITSQRVFVGLTSTVLNVMTTADNPILDYIGIQYSTNRGDTNWQVIEKDNVTQTVTNTGLAVAANQQLMLEIIYTSSQTATVNIHGGGGAGILYTATHNTSMPRTTSNLKFACGMDDTGAGVRGFFVGGCSTQTMTGWVL